MKLIDKDALVAEIESYKSTAEWMLKGKTDLEHWRSQKGVCDKLLYFITSLEVKEFDFGTEVYKYIDEHFNVYDDGNQTLQTKDKKSLIGMVDVENIAKHFFELGLKAQKGEEV